MRARIFLNIVIVLSCINIEVFLFVFFSFGSQIMENQIDEPLRPKSRRTDQSRLIVAYNPISRSRELELD